MRFNSVFLLLGALYFSSAAVISRQEDADVAEVAEEADVTEIASYDPAEPIELPWESDPQLWELPTVAARSQQSCKCGPTDACWPSDLVWGLLDVVFGGRLIKTTPIASVCHAKTTVDDSTFASYNAPECSVVQSNWNTPDVGFPLLREM